MQRAQDYYPECPEAFLVSLARSAWLPSLNPVDTIAGLTWMP